MTAAAFMAEKIDEYIRTLRERAARAEEAARTPIPMRLVCPRCRELHVDVGEFATKVHHTHACQHCGEVWRPAVVATVGVRFLPGFRDDTIDHQAGVAGRARASAIRTAGARVCETCGDSHTMRFGERAPLQCTGCPTPSTGERRGWRAPTSIPTSYLAAFRQLGCTSAADIRAKCAEARARGMRVFPPCDRAGLDGGCLGHPSPGRDEACVSMFVITHGTKDYGDRFVVREHVLSRFGDFLPLLAPTRVVDTLDDARAAVRDAMRALVPERTADLYCIERGPEDDPVIVEWWV